MTYVGCCSREMASWSTADKEYMVLALAEATKALQALEVPVG